MLSFFWDGISTLYKKTLTYSGHIIYIGTCKLPSANECIKHVFDSSFTCDYVHISASAAKEIPFNS